MIINELQYIYNGMSQLKVGVSRTEQGPGPPENSTRPDRFWVDLRIFGS